jgi:stage V sporulation protein B
MSFLRGALVLSCAGLITKIIGALYRIPLTYLLGAEGIGLYQMAYPIYGIAFVLSSSGVPIAIAKLIAEQNARGYYRAAQRILGVAMLLLACTGFIFAFLMYRLAPVIATGILGDARALYPIRAITPAVFFVAVLAAFRGYFQGRQLMLPIAIGQILEQLVRVTTMLGLAYILLPWGLEYAAAGATFGAVTGAIAGIFCLGLVYVRIPKPVGSAPVEEDNGVIVGKILRLALPVTFGAFIMPVMEAVDAAIVPMRLQAIGYTVSQATALYGQLAGMAISLIVFPTVITGAFAFSLIPAISEAVTQGRHELIERRVQEALHLTVLVGLPATVGLYLLPGELCELLFRTPEAGIPLVYLAYGCFFLCLQQTTTGILQGMGRPAVPVRSILFGALCNAILNYYLTVIPALNIRGAALGTGFGFTVAALLNLRAIVDITGIKISIGKLFFPPILALIGMALAVKLGYNWAGFAMGGNTAVLVAILLGAFVYLLLGILTGAIPWRYIALLLPFRLGTKK